MRYKNAIPKVRQIFDQASLEVLSLDVFDTLLFRDIRPEWKRFLDLSATLSDWLWQGLGIRRDRDDIMRARLVSARIAYQTAPSVDGTREGRFCDIIRLQVDALRLPRELESDFRRIEIEAEIASLRLNRRIADIAAEAKERGYKVVLLSDMYLDRFAILELLEAHGAKALFDQLYVSSELGVAKHAGTMFPVVEAREAKKSAAFLHIGDHRFADYVAPRRRGWQAIWLPRELPWRLINRPWVDMGRILSPRWPW